MYNPGNIESMQMINRMSHQQLKKMVSEKYEKVSDLRKNVSHYMNIIKEFNESPLLARNYDKGVVDAYEYLKEAVEEIKSDCAFVDQVSNVSKDKEILKMIRYMRAAETNTEKNLKKADVFKQKREERGSKYDSLKNEELLNMLEENYYKVLSLLDTARLYTEVLDTSIDEINEIATEMKIEINKLVKKLFTIQYDILLDERGIYLSDEPLEMLADNLEADEIMEILSKICDKVFCLYHIMRNYADMLCNFQRPSLLPRKFDKSVDNAYKQFMKGKAEINVLVRKLEVLQDILGSKGVEFNKALKGNLRSVKRIESESIKVQEEKIEYTIIPTRLDRQMRIQGIPKTNRMQKADEVKSPKVSTSQPFDTTYNRETSKSQEQNRLNVMSRGYLPNTDENPKPIANPSTSNGCMNWRMSRSFR